MMYLFSKSGLKLLESLCFTKTLFAFDFDGTLSRIVKDPENAKISKSTLDLLLELERCAPVAVISGRSIRDLSDKFLNPPRFLIGNHGLEGLDSKEEDKDTYKQACHSWKATLNQKITACAGTLGGIEIEDKTYSLAIHYRKSRKKGEAKEFILDSIQDLSPEPRVILGKCVVNIVPVGGPHKGISLLALMNRTQTKSAFYIGDDDTDEDVFALPTPGLFTVRVGKKLNSHARFFIENQAEINLLLEKILSFSNSERATRVSQEVAL